ncbi:predicted protein [Aspergillus nidulans FGSC A4]|uniref:Uncharacterized protein n=1 Tax=Emericella nidulans (strain FGSC A4 / ATCC 38163 / CBS 112.46 / NRRL 194 / M139) TaxID=227321 RepID=Q5B5N9_EMENI|nr:hypothetical protein [Aspergillus nidulans FGSC A4]EAA59402.1 predicted protein [Aspergillus nidulans FGSC A4]CBF74617.1 TPA: conserved hypothetical protein [Aspergillus nidulans FGSC A4]|eukprot:XP_661745.1 predicted protein [Aspergillus nidulans FGSC A4]
MYMSVTQQNSPIVLDALGFEKSAALLQHRESLTSSFYARIARFLSVEVSFAHETSAVQPFKRLGTIQYLVGTSCNDILIFPLSPDLPGSPFAKVHPRSSDRRQKPGRIPIGHSGVLGRYWALCSGIGKLYYPSIG